MNAVIKNVLLGFLLIHSLQGLAQFNYKITIQGDPLIKSLNGNNIAGETNVRIKIYGDNNQTLLGGKLCVGDFSTVVIKDKPDIGSISGVDIELTGKGWTKPVKINNINIKKENDAGDFSKKYSFSCGCTLTQGNALVKIDEAGALDFTEADIAAPEFTLDGEFSKNDYEFSEENIRGVVSKTRTPKSEKSNGQPVVSKTPQQICTEELVSATASFDVNFIQNPNESNIFPGAMLYSEDIANGSYSSYASGSDLNPINLTTTIAIVGGNPTITVVDPDLGTINTAINDLLINQTKGEMEVQASFEVSEINSMEELTLKLGAHFNSATFDAKLSADLHTVGHKSIKMVKFVQKYYSVTMVQPKKPTDLFKDKRKATEAFQSGKTPLYVNSITYGRVCYFFLESEDNATDFKAHLEAEYHGSVTAGGEGDVATRKALNSMKYSATIIGGSGSNGILAVDGYEGFMRMLRDDGKLDKTALALPISYSCKFLADNKQAFVNLYSSYTKRTCQPVKSNKIKAIIRIDDFVTLEQPNETNYWGFNINALTGTTNGVDYVTRLSFDKGSNADAAASRVGLKINSPYSIDKTSDVFLIDLNDYNSGKLKLYFSAFVVRSPLNGLYTTRTGNGTKSVLMKDALNLQLTAGAPAKDFIVQFEDMKVKFTYRVELIKD